MINYYTEANLNITERVELGDTKIFDSVVVAERYADYNNSYYYNAYSVDEKGKQTACFAVPK